MTETETTKAPECQRQHGDTFCGFTGGVLIVLFGGMAVFGLNLPSAARLEPWCSDFKQYGYHVVPFGNRVSVWLEEFRQKMAYQPKVRLYASPFNEAYGWNDPCDGQEIIVLSLQDLNSMGDNELKALLAHEFGHKLAGRHKNPTDGSSEQGQREADGYGIELVGDDAFRAYWRHAGWTEEDVRKKLKEGKKALADLRKRAPLV